MRNLILAPILCAVAGLQAAPMQEDRCRAFAPRTPDGNYPCSCESSCTFVTFSGAIKVCKFQPNWQGACDPLASAVAAPGVTASRFNGECMPPPNIYFSSVGCLCQVPDGATSQGTLVLMTQCNNP